LLEQQKTSLIEKNTGMLRDDLQSLPNIQSHALIVSGIRRCGKSTLLFQLLKQQYQDAIYLNFDDPRLYNFEIEDFVKLDTLISENGSKVLMFDEIQIIKGWERYVRQKLDENFHVIVTGSNASLLSKELGTSLTGRHITKELFPFSFNEYCRFTEKEAVEESLVSYMLTGGFPNTLKLISKMF
jgi:predicted AAA+ superfamily ATPase